jgi:hypothetical protein
MNKKKPAKAKKPASTRNLSPKKLTAKQASSVKGGNLVCAAGTHMKEVTITP